MGYSPQCCQESDTTERLGMHHHLQSISIWRCSLGTREKDLIEGAQRHRNPLLFKPHALKQGCISLKEWSFFFSQIFTGCYAQKMPSIPSTLRQLHATGSCRALLFRGWPSASDHSTDQFPAHSFGPYSQRNTGKYPDLCLFSLFYMK